MKYFFITFQIFIIFCRGITFQLFLYVNGIPLK